MQIVCRHGDSSETAVELEASVSRVPEEDWEEGDEVSHSFGLLRDPPAAVFDPAIYDLEAEAAEAMAAFSGSQRGRLRKRFETARLELQLPLARQRAVEALRGLFEKLSAYEGEVGMTSFLRLDEVSVGAGAMSLHASIHQEPDNPRVNVQLESHLRSADDLVGVETRLSQIVARLEAAAPTA